MRILLQAAVLMLLLGGANMAAAMTKEGKGCLGADPFRDELTTIDLCAAAIRTKGNSDAELASLHHQRGEAFYWTQRTDLAIEEFNRALELDRNAVEAQIQRGWAKLRVNDISGAFQDFSDALAKKPSGRAVYGIGFLYEHYSSEPKRALAAYEEALRLTPDYHLARLALVDYFRGVEWNPERALRELDTLMAIDANELRAVRYFDPNPRGPRDFTVEVRSLRARILTGVGSYKDALRELDALVAEYPGEARLYDLRAELHWKMNSPPEVVLSDVTRSEELPYSCRCLIVVKLSALSRLNRFEEIDEISTSKIDGIGSQYEKSAAHYFRGMVRKHRNDSKGAMSDFEIAAGMSEHWSGALLTQLVQRGYYTGGTSDKFNQKARVGLEACLADPECMQW